MGAPKRLENRLILYISALLVVTTILVLFNYSSLTSFEAGHAAVLQPEPMSMEAKMVGRVQRVKDLCRKYHLGREAHEDGRNDLGVKDPPSPQYSYFFLNKPFKLAWCPVYKAGSTSWLHNMMLLAGISEAVLEHIPKQLSSWARDLYGDPEPGPAFDNSFKILVVRHPFDRILSAYRDKLSNSTIGLEHGTAHFQEKYGKGIVAKYRSPNSTFTRIEPTFEEFVRYLIGTDLVTRSDDHWLPAYYSCTPCRVTYDVIAKTETYIRDQDYIIDRLNLSSLIKAPQWIHRTDELLREAQDVLDPARFFYSLLSKRQIRDLYHKYWLDFELFDYSHLKYLEWGRD